MRIGSKSPWALSQGDDNMGKWIDVWKVCYKPSWPPFQGDHKEVCLKDGKGL